MVGLALALAALAVGCKRKPEPEESGASQPAQPAETPAAAPAPLNAEPVPPICADLCKRALALDCGTVELCADGCRRMLGLPVCQTEVLAFLNCATAEPDAHWECDQGGPTPSLEESYCAAPRTALAGCLAKGSVQPP